MKNNNSSIGGNYFYKPTKLLKKFPDHKNCVKHLEKIRWGDNPKCVYCKSEKVCKHKEKNKTHWQCWSCKKSFSVTVGAIFHHTHIDIQKWFLVMHLMLCAKKGTSCYQVAREPGMHRPTVWSMTHRIRKAMQTDQVDLLQGTRRY